MSADSLAVLCEMSGLKDHIMVLRDAGITLPTLAAMHQEQGRPKVLKALKEAGISSLTARQSIANAVGKFSRTGCCGDATDESIAGSTDSIGPAPPGSVTVHVRAAGAMGGDNCPLNGKFRNTTLHTAAPTVKVLFEELRAARGYQLDYSNVRVSISGAQAQHSMVDADMVASTPITEGLQVMLIGPNRGG